MTPTDTADLVARLRLGAHVQDDPLLREAAEAIERLEAASVKLLDAEQSRVLIWHERRALRYRQLQDVHGHQRYQHLIRRHQEVVDAIRQLLDEIARLRRTAQTEPTHE